MNNAIKAKELNIFSDVIVNSESDEIGNIVKDFNITFYKRPEALANDEATSEQFVYDFMKNNNCDYLIQLHSIAPLINEKEIVDFYLKQFSNVEACYHEKFKIDNHLSQVI